MRLPRLVLVVVLSLFASGAPRVLAAALDDDCCNEPCSGALDGKHCPPNCDQGSCAKTHASLAAVQASMSCPLSSLAEVIELTRERPHLPVLARGVFHPPRS